MEYLSKEKIIEEIQRTSSSNNGKPLGQTAFRNETGIRSWDWGRYWTKWSNALTEAGFEPNKPWVKYEKGILEEDAIKLIRKLGHYFTKAEMRLEFIDNPDFHFAAIDKRKKGEFINSLIEYCKSRKGYEDIVGICEPILADISGKESPIDNLLENGEVYLAKHGSQPHYKIGFTNDVMRRGKEISVILPEKLEIIHSIRTDDPSGVESYWHKRFADKRMNGEWFKLNRYDVAAFKRWRKIL
jgi:hypothetical protein